RSRPGRRAALRIYVNGAPAGAAARTGAVAVNSNPLSLGGRAGAGEGLDGLLDEARVLDRALAEEEVAASQLSGGVRYSTVSASGPWTYLLDPASAAVTGASGTTATQVSTAAGLAFVQDASDYVQFLAQDTDGNTAV